MEFEGILKKVIFAGDNGYQIAAIEDIATEEEIMAVGYFKLFSNQVYMFEGDIDYHAKYGEQFKVNRYSLKVLEEGEEIVNFLSSDAFKGVGKRKASKIVKQYGQEAVEVIKNNPQEVIDTLNIDEKLIFEMSATLNSLDGMDTLYELLNPLGFTPFYITEIYQYIQQENILSVQNFIKKTPYEMCENIECIPFEKADQIFLHYEGNPEDEYRTYHAVIDEISTFCHKTGDTNINKEDLIRNMNIKLGFKIENIEELFTKLAQDKKIIVEDDLVILYDFWLAEKQIASNIMHRLDILKLGLDQNLISVEIAKIEEKSKINYSGVQKEAIVNSLSNNVSIITGGPGTGKTTIINAVVQIFKKLKYQHEKEKIKDISDKIMLCAPTGRAAQRMKEATGVDAKTIHSLLEWDPYKNEFQRDSENILLQDLIIIDEFSMVDIFLASSLLKAIKPSAIVIIVGDSAQLESVNPGNVLYDLISINSVPLVHLDKIFRQGDGSTIAKFAKEIDNGDKIDFVNTQDMSMINKEVNLLNIIKQIVDKSYENGYTEMEVQVLYPKYSGSQGIDKINEYLLVNQDKKSVEGYEGVIFYLNDKVMQLRNNYDKGIYNGDIGNIVQVYNPKTPNDLALEVEFRNIKVVLTKKELIDLKHAYAISIHKSQGSEFKVVILPITEESSKMLNKKIIYTAVTRAKDKLIIVGNLEVLKDKILKETPNRSTNLKELVAKMM